MNIHLNSISNYSATFLKERILSSLTSQQKKIIVIASIAFGLLAALYLAIRCCLKNKESADKNQPDVKPEIDHETKLKPLNEKDIETNGTEKIIDPDNSVGNDELKDRLLNDKGEITYPDGSVAEGEFNKLGWLDGKGKITSTNGSVMEGEFKNGKLHGEGKAMYFEEKSTISNGKMEFVEEGEFKNGWLHQGKRTFASGIVDEGEFKYSNLHGQGKRTYLHGSVEKGEFYANRLHGQGKITYSYGSVGVVEEGEFKDGKLHGQGKKSDSNGKVEEGIFDKGILIQPKSGFNPPQKIKLTLHNDSVAEGVFNKNGSLHGQGKIKTKDGTILEGEFKNGQLQQGKMITPQGAVWEGEFKEDSKKYRLHGSGKMIHTNGTVIEGKFEDGSLLQGKMITKNGVEFEGEFKDGKLHGQGKKSHPDGRKEEGIFEKGKLIQPKK